MPAAAGAWRRMVQSKYPSSLEGPAESSLKRSCYGIDLPKALLSSDSAPETLS